MVKELVWVATKSWERLLGVKIVIRLLSCIVQGRITTAVGAPEGGVGIIWQVPIGVKQIMVVLIF